MTSGLMIVATGSPPLSNAAGGDFSRRSRSVTMPTGAPPAAGMTSELTRLRDMSRAAARIETPAAR